MTIRDPLPRVSSRCVRLALSAALVLGAMPAAVSAFASYDDDAAKARQERRRNVSIWVDADWGFRKRGAANELNRAHQAYAAHGFEVLDVDPYIENGDLQGFFVTYRQR